MKPFSIVCFIMLLPAAVSAQVYNCNGTYSNLPCNQRASAPDAGDTRARLKDDGSKRILSEKRSVMHELSMFVIDTNRRYKLSYSTEQVDDFCLNQETSLDECRKRADEMRERIETRIVSLENIKAQRRANELKEKEIEATKESTEQNLTIIEQPIYIIKKPRHGNGHGRPGHGHGRPGSGHGHGGQGGDGKVDEPPVDKLQTYGGRGSRRYR